MTPATFVIRPRDYQLEAVSGVLRAAADTSERPALKRQVVVLPTGTGKTIVIAMLVQHHVRQGGRALILAHREELIDQAVAKLRMVEPGLDIGVVRAAHNEPEAQVVVASVPTVRQPSRLRQLGDFQLVVVDEAHHAPADSYRYVLSQKGLWLEDGPLVVGVTATPERSDRTSLLEVFDGGITYQKSLLWMIENGYLCDLWAQQIFLDMDLDQVPTRGGARGDFQDDALGDAMVKANAPDEVARAYLAYAAGRKGICFAPSIHASELIAEQLETRGVRVAHIDHRHPRERQAAIRGLRQGDLDLICNCGILTEGYDEPSINVIICARPTVFRGLYQQMIGRGTRPYPGKTDCLILDVVGNTTRHDLATLTKLYKLKPRQSILEAEEEERQAQEALAAGTEEAQIGRWKGGLKAKPVSLFRGAHVAWKQTEHGTWFVNMGREHGTLVLRQEAAPGDGRPCDDYRVERLVLGKKGGPRLEALAVGVDEGYAYGLARDHIAEVPRWQIDEYARWRLLPASSQQIAYLDRLGVDYPAGITRGEASDLITLHNLNKGIANEAKRRGAASANMKWKLGNLGVDFPADITWGEAYDLLSEHLDP